MYFFIQSIYFTNLIHFSKYQQKSKPTQKSQIIHTKFSPVFSFSTFFNMFISFRAPVAIQKQCSLIHLFLRKLFIQLS